MKKFILVVLALALCFGLIACSDNDSSDSRYKKYAKHKELFEYLEKDDYESANAYIQDFFGKTEEEENEEVSPDLPMESEPVEDEPVVTEPEVTEPTYTTVEITMDNWQDYFEVISTTGCRANAFGELELFQVFQYIVSKEEYSLVDCDVTFEYHYDLKLLDYTINFEEETITYGEEPKGISETEPKIEEMGWRYGGRDDRYSICCDVTYLYKLEGTLYLPFNFEVLRVIGTIVIAE